MSEASLISSTETNDGAQGGAAKDTNAQGADQGASAQKDDAAKTAEQKDTSSGVEKTQEQGDKAKTEIVPLDLSDVTVELPDGMALNANLLKELGTVAGELGLSKENAQKFLPIGVKMAESFALKQQEVYAQTRQTWRDQVAADKDIGGADDKARTANLALASKGLEAYGSKELRTLLDESGIGDHPEVIRLFHKLGKTASEDKVEGGGSGTRKDPLGALYPSMAQKA